MDIGGTFTDLVAVNDESSKLFVLKVKSTPKSPEDAFIHILKRLFAENQISPSMVNRIIHVGTIGSNLFLGQLGIRMPTAALVTTRGFRDIIEIGRQNRSELYNVFFQRPKPLVPRRFRFEVEERIDAHGNVMVEVDDEELKSLARTLKNDGVESVAISFLNSYLNPENERKTKSALATAADFVFSSSEVDPEHREYERTSTTVVNSVLAPVISEYLGSALSKLKDIGIRAPVQLFSSSGGLVELEVARKKPIVAVESGPAAGVVGAAELAKALGQRNILSLDMGGTTAKAGCVVDYNPSIIPEIEVGGRTHLGRVIKGSGYPVRYPSVDLAEVSAGGGTIVWADQIGALKVGPISAGADPGPACYASKGKDATITDANLLLGRLGSTLLGREMELNVTLAARAMEQVAEKIGMSTIETAAAAIKLVNLHMSRAVDIVSLERGQDPRNFTLIAFGGAGPMHAAELAEQVGVNMVIIPPYPGLFSALGMMMTDMKYAYVKGVLKPLDDLPDEFFEETWKQMTLESETSLELRTKDGDPTRSVLRSVDARYLGQGYELEIQAAGQFNRQAFKESFEKKHEMVYGYVHPGERLEITALRLTVLVPVTKLDLRALDSPGSELDSENRRLVWFADDWLDTPILRRDKLQQGRTIDGPAIFEEYDSTIIVPPNWHCRKETGNCLVLERRS